MTIDLVERAEEIYRDLRFRVSASCQSVPPYDAREAPPPGWLTCDSCRWITKEPVEHIARYHHLQSESVVYPDVEWGAA